MAEASQADRRMEEVIKLYQDMLRERRLILLSNRGPVEHQAVGDSQIQARRGTGTVVTALGPLARHLELTWVSSAMGEGDRRVAETAEGAAIASPLPSHRMKLRYVVTPRRVYHKYYNIFCNPLLWFLQHYMWSSPYTPNIDDSVHDAWENGYIPVNKAFADAVIAEAQGQQKPPYLLVHDYHLYLVPMYVRQALPAATISHFVHIPWPSPAYWLLLPSNVRTAICRALCQTDILGFQCDRDARSFLGTCEEFLPDAEVDHVKRTVELSGQKVRVRSYPISIDVEELRRIANSPRSLEYERRLQPICSEKTIVRVDRLEPSKNLVRGFRAYQLLLERHAELRGKVTFLAFLAPSRTRVKQYQRYAEEVDEQVQLINSAFGTETWKPIHAFYENNYTQAVAGLRLYDVLLVNSVIDGMNLVAKEGPVVNTRNGTLVLSESVGSYDQLRKGALCVSPTDIEGTMQALYKALTMPEQERKERAATLVEATSQEDLAHWLKIQVQDLMEVGARG